MIEVIFTVLFWIAISILGGAFITFLIVSPTKRNILYEIKKEGKLKYRIYKDGMYVETFDNLFEAIEKVDALKEQFIKDKKSVVYRKKIKV